MSSAIMVRADIDEIVAHRDKSIQLFAEGVDVLKKCLERARLAAPSGLYATPFGREFPTQEDWRKSIDRASWEHVMKATKMDVLMDREAREAFYKQLKDDPPPLDAATAQATVETYYEDRNRIFNRGIANAFSLLDKRFKTHDGFKIGSKIILTFFLDSFGSIHHRTEDTLLDVERAFMMLDEKHPTDRLAGIIGVLRTALSKCYYRTGYAVDVETDYFRVKTFKNGNAHVFFKRDDLVVKVNKALADHYGAVLGDSHTKTYQNSSVVPKNMGAFMTPPAAVKTVMDFTWIRDGEKVLEPSAGEGALAIASRDKGADVTCIELHPDRASKLRSLGFKVGEADFLTVTPTPTFDRVVMNPPFGHGVDCDHVRHALGFLKPGGQLTAIMSAGSAYNETGRYLAFRREIERYEHIWRDLPPGSFLPETNVNTVVLTLSVPR